MNKFDFAIRNQEGDWWFPTLDRFGLTWFLHNRLSVLAEMHRAQMRAILGRGTP